MLQCRKSAFKQYRNNVKFPFLFLIDYVRLMANESQRSEAQPCIKSHKNAHCVHSVEQFPKQTGSLSIFTLSRSTNHGTEMLVKTLREILIKTISCFMS